MVHPCIVEGCKNKARDGIFRFPRDPVLRMQWIQSLDLNLTEPLSDTARVCGGHFKEEDFQRDLKGELLGIPTRRKTLTDDAVPTREKLSWPIPRNVNDRRYLPTGAGSVSKGKKALQRKGGLICPELPQGRMGVTGLGISRNFTAQTAPSTKKFQRQKEEILQRLKQEAAMNVMRDKLTAAAAELEMVDEDGNPIGPDPDDPPEAFDPQLPSTSTAGSTNSSTMHLPGFQPHQCVILQPVDSEGSGNSDVPVIIPGDPKHIQKTLLKDPKVQEFIQNQVAENRDAVQANDASAIVLNTFQSHSVFADLEKPTKVRNVSITGEQKQYIEETIKQEVINLD